MPKTSLPAARPPRVVVQNVAPCVDGGRYDAKATQGDPVVIEADAFLDGHDLISCDVLYRAEGERSWRREPMALLGNDRWRATIVPDQLGRYEFRVVARVDELATWLHDLDARITAGQEIEVEVLVGVQLITDAASAAKAGDRRRLLAIAAALPGSAAPELRALGAEAAALIERKRPPAPTTSSEVFGLRAERQRARFSTWYELFPRSTAPKRGVHGSLHDVIQRLDYVAELGADVLYLPPIHPIGSTSRKGPNNAATAKKKDVGSPWAIGAAEGGHTAVHPALGTLDDFDALVGKAQQRGIEVALDLAFQCSPDHPWVTEHPEWFKHRPDGSIRYAENPPKRYEDVYPLDFDTDDWAALWNALLEVVEFWIGHGVRIFRVDNPHTKPFRFWEWLIADVQRRHDDIIFLAEAFTRPGPMYRLAKLGFSQSYTYFTWRAEKWELEDYLTELTSRPVIDFFRPNFWPNTPDILTEQLQTGGRAMFVVRALLAGTLAASYGMYGPVFELQESTPRVPGSEEYLDAEKYEVRHFDLDAPHSIAAVIAAVNKARREHVALQHDTGLRFHHTDNDQVIAYSKTVPPGVATAAAVHAPELQPVIAIANLDVRNEQSAWIDLDLAALGLLPDSRYVVTDLLSGESYEWTGSHNFVILDPATRPAHLFRVEAPAGIATEAVA